MTFVLKPRLLPDSLFAWGINQAVALYEYLAFLCRFTRAEALPTIL